MPKLAANLSMMFTENAFLERFEAAAAAGFTAVEYLFPYDFAPAEVAAALKSQNLTQALFNLPPGDWEAGERGIACLPGREADFRASIHEALVYAKALGCERLHMMAGLVPAGASAEQVEQTYIDNLIEAAGELEQAGCALLIEPINPIDMPGYFLQTAAQARGLIDKARSRSGKPLANVAIQLDLYHRQMLEGRVADAIDEFIAQSAHVQIAGVPGRHEPDRDGEVNWEWVLKRLDDAGFDGYVGCEYRPAGRTEDGLRWAAPWLGHAGLPVEEKRA